MLMSVSWILVPMEEFVKTLKGHTNVNAPCLGLERTVRQVRLMHVQNILVKYNRQKSKDKYMFNIRLKEKID